MPSDHAHDSGGAAMNTLNYYDEPDANNNLTGNESSASPPPPTATLPISTGDSQTAKWEDTIPEDTEKDEYNEKEDENEQDGQSDEQADEQPEPQEAHEVDTEQDAQQIAKLEADLEAMRSKLEQIKIENMVFTQEMASSSHLTSLTNEYDEKIMQYDREYLEQQQLIEEEERVIEELEREFQEKLAKHNIDEASLKNNEEDINGMIRGGASNSKHAQKSSIVLYDNSFAINHQLQLEIDKLTNQIDWLQQSKIKLVRNTANEVDRLRAIIKQFQK